MEAGKIEGTIYALQKAGTKIYEKRRIKIPLGSARIGADNLYRKRMMLRLFLRTQPLYTYISSWVYSPFGYTALIVHLVLAWVASGEAVGLCKAADFTTSPVFLQPIMAV